MQKPFNFFVPITYVEKGKSTKTGKTVMKVGGVASTSDKDTDQQSLKPEGFNLDYFLKTGFINWNHLGKTDPEMNIGEPTKAEIKPEGLVIEGELYDDNDQAVKVYKELERQEKRAQAGKSTRRYGWSIEGKVLDFDENDPSNITQVMITGVAITPTPKNNNTFVDIVKGEISFKDYVFEFDEKNSKHTSQEKELASDIKKMEKALETRKQELSAYRRNKAATGFDIAGFDTDEFAKAVVEEMEFRQKKVNQENGLVLKSLVEGYRERSDDLFDLQEKIVSISKALDTFLRTPNPRKSFVVPPEIRKSEESSKQLDTSIKQLDITRDRSQILSQLERKINWNDTNPNSINAKLKKSLLLYEATGFLEKAAVDELTKEGFSVIGAKNIV